MMLTRGSRNYNLNTEKSDEDFTHLYFPSLEQLWFDKKPEESHDGDVQQMDVRHFLHLLEKGNHSALELLYAVKVTGGTEEENAFYKRLQEECNALMVANRSGFYWSVFGSMRSELNWLRKNPNAPSGKRMAQVKRWYNLLEATKDPEKLYRTTKVYLPRKGKHLAVREMVNPFYLSGLTRSQVLWLKLDEEVCYNQKSYLMEKMFADAEAMFEAFNTPKASESLFEEFRQMAFEVSKTTFLKENQH